MALLKTKRYRTGGELVYRSRVDGVLRKVPAGTELSEEEVASFGDRELDVLLGNAQLVEVGAKPPPRPAPPPPRTLTPAEIFGQVGLDPEAVLGFAVHVVEKASDADVKKLVNPDRPAPRFFGDRPASPAAPAIVAHKTGGVWVGTLDLGRLAQLLAGRPTAR